jgi:D-alanyl-D-alanine endopeptidase (penicillin-binding protein 7)
MRAMKRLALLVAIGMLSIAPASEAGPATGPLASLSGSPDVRSAAVLIIDEANSSVLYQRQAAMAAPIASITKLMTALVVLDAGQPLDESILITKEDTNSVKGAHSRLPIGAVSRGGTCCISL